MKANMFVLLSVAAMAARCGVAPEARDGAAAGGVAEAASTLLASVALEGDRVVSFYKAEAGFVFITETGKAGGAGPRMDAPDVAGRSPVEIYQILAPSAEVPGALLDADVGRQSVAASLFEAPANEVSVGRGAHVLKSTGEQTWFRQTFCPGAAKCIQGWDWIDSGADQTDSWKSTAWVGSEGRQPAAHVAYYWRCVNGSCAWAQFNSMSTQPGRYTWISGGGLFYYRATLTGAGANTQVSMAVNVAYNCAFCNDGTCQCGYSTTTNLCAAHRGVDTSLGCTQQR